MSQKKYLSKPCPLSSVTAIFMVSRYGYPPPARRSGAAENAGKHGEWQRQESTARLKLASPPTSFCLYKPTAAYTCFGGTRQKQL